MLTNFFSRGARMRTKIRYGSLLRYLKFSNGGGCYFKLFQTYTNEQLTKSEIARVLPGPTHVSEHCGKALFL